jgi:hypothetical protein
MSAMHYYFHVRDAQGVTRDEKDTELCDLAAARVEALFSALDFAIEDIKRGPCSARSRSATPTAIC